jgi:poly(A)-specific ribonuclease
LIKAASSAEPESNSVPKIELPQGADREAMENLKKQISEWLGQGAEQPLEIPMESAFLRLLAHTFVSQEFPGLFSHSTKRGDIRLLCVYKRREDLFAEQKRSLEQELLKIDSELGARALFDTMSASRIPIVGHNCFYDLLHTFKSFYGEVPPYVDQFKQKWLAKFPRTFDTKYIAESSDVLGGLQPPATLKGLCEFMLAGQGENPLTVSIDAIGPEFSYHLPAGTGHSDLSHDAGYDAMMTSLVFLLQLRHILERRSLRFDQVDFKQPTGKAAANDGPPRIPVHELLRTAVNRIRLVKTQPPSLNLREREP